MSGEPVSRCLGAVAGLPRFPQAHRLPGAQVPRCPGSKVAAGVARLGRLVVCFPVGAAVPPFLPSRSARALASRVQLNPPPTLSSSPAPGPPSESVLLDWLEQRQLADFLSPTSLRRQFPPRVRDHAPTSASTRPASHSPTASRLRLTDIDSPPGPAPARYVHVAPSHPSTQGGA